MARRLRPSQTARDPTGLAARAAVEPTCLGSSGFLGHPGRLQGPVSTSPSPSRGLSDPRRDS